ncbi:mechanosensitive ion channel family protein [Bacteroides helcogenes]|uniref:MscS Mechanosensitive ion channel n=1 Tax=Bacteroides helcogenes (strain ATCC 35417 / DSM 20613 / JCM 6297 / CCUG 15421 / P 36-108) TaxID=693979 RepID=E6STS6_BACT6|nr:mechanosensitive ion channel family protein [Bacteroides helcogenes]ADV42279.1 MscS Mechanosensitive ion channel [Bacteroides helcogenes P 36-108]MDY5237267.1 mechanosensitive ion channel family protein [Bacteroides helcogenes]
MKKSGFLFLLFLCMALPSKAVLKEKDLARTLGVLKAELERTYQEQKVNLLRYEQMTQMQHARLIEFMQRSDQIALMLYSQKSDFTFDLTYACQEATEQYKKLRATNLPYDKIKDRIMEEVARYNGLIRSLEELPPAIGKDSLPPPPLADAHDSLFVNMSDSLLHRHIHHSDDVHIFLLDDRQKADRELCLIFAKAIRNNMIRLQNAILQDSRHYAQVSEKLKTLNDYAMKRYESLQQNIFVNGGDNYFSMLSRIGRNYKMAKKDVSDKYMPLKENRIADSEWRGPIVFSVSFFTLFYILIATLLSNIIMRWLLPKRIRVSEAFRTKRPLLMLTVGVAIFALAVMVARISVKQNFVLMACGLLINFAWLLAAILLSLLVRLKGKQLKSGIKIYAPFLWMAFLVIAFRIILIPNNLVNLIYPPILLGFTFWQYWVLKRLKTKLPGSDMVYSGVSMAAMVVACLVSWSGYVLLAVQIMIWWIFQLAAIQTITCCYDLMKMFEAHYMVKKILAMYGADALNKGRLHWMTALRGGEFIHKTWSYDFVNRALMPILAVISVLASIYWAADVFDMTAVCRKIFFFNFVDEKGVIQLSLFKISLVTACWFFFSYLNYVFKSFYKHYKTKRSREQNYNLTLASNVIAISVWGIYFIFALVLLQVPKSGISLVTAGLATGLGFAMKDLLENFFYGISLMTGRVRVGDYIECDGILGKVESITYQSTQVVTWDGSIIAFLNASLFNKNFKNLTRNHSYELVKVPIGVAYGTDVDEVRSMLTSAIKPLMVKNADGRQIVSGKQGVKVAISDFGDNSVNLLIVFWVLVEEKVGFVSRVNEVIYNTLNKNHIEIPFPQRDIYIRKMPDKE